MDIVLQIILLISAAITFLVSVLILIYLKVAVLDGRRIEAQFTKLNSLSLPSFPVFEIHNPYQEDGTYYKVQLHTHTIHSDGELSPDEIIAAYHELGYSFLAITDHDRINKDIAARKEIKIIPGEEMTHNRPFLPTGYHLSRLFIEHDAKGKLQEKVDETLKQGGLIVINHPSFIGNLCLQRWLPAKLLNLDNIPLIEISNHFTDAPDNIRYWELLLKHYGPERSVWAVAGDDTHTAEDINRDWIMVKLPDKTDKALLEALRRGSFYPSQGPEVTFNVEERQIAVSSRDILSYRFLDSDSNILLETTDKKAQYQPRGNEGYIRIEAECTKTGKKAWSQPFWLQPLEPSSPFFS